MVKAFLLSVPGGLGFIGFTGYQYNEGPNPGISSFSVEYLLSHLSYASYQSQYRKIIRKIPPAALLLRNLSRRYRLSIVAGTAPEEGSTRLFN